MTPEVMYESDQTIVARDLAEYTLHKRTADNIPAHRANDEVPDNFGAVFPRIWELPSKLDVHIKAGDKLYACGPGVVEAIDTTGQEPKVVWHAEIEGTPQRMLAADEKLFIVTSEGSILAFGAPQPGDATSRTRASGGTIRRVPAMRFLTSSIVLILPASTRCFNPVVAHAPAACHPLSSDWAGKGSPCHSDGRAARDARACKTASSCSVKG